MEDQLGLLMRSPALQRVRWNDYADAVLLALQDDVSGIESVVDHVVARGHSASHHGEFEWYLGFDDRRCDLCGKRPCGRQRKKRTTNECFHITSSGFLALISICFHSGKREQS